MTGGKPDAIINIYKRTIFLFVNNVSPDADANRPRRATLLGPYRGTATARIFLSSPRCILVREMS